MSKLIVEVCQVEKVEDHPNPGVERMKVATVKGWKICIGYDPKVRKAQFVEGDKCIYFPPDTVLPPTLANGPGDTPAGRLNVMRFCAMLPKDPVTNVRPLGGRVRAARLQGYPSYGVIAPIDTHWGDDPHWEIGTNLCDHFGVTKWEPRPCPAPDAASHCTFFHTYTSIEHYGNYPKIISAGTEVVITEKLHGSNTRVGMVVTDDNAATSTWEYMVGSHNTRRMKFGTDGRRSMFWDALTPNVKRLLAHLRNFPWTEKKFSIVVFGELIGTMDMKYGLSKGSHEFRAFDIAINGRYLNFEDKETLFKRFCVEMVPILYRGPFNTNVVEEYTNGPTTACPAHTAGKFAGREGIVITPTVEQICPVSNDRLILKSLSVDHLSRKGGTDGH